MPGAALITDHNYSTGFRQVRGLGHDLLRVMGIPTLPGQPILPALAIMALAAFGLEGIALNAYTNSLPEALASLANSNLALGGFVLVSSAAIALLAFAAARWLRHRAPAPRAALGGGGATARPAAADPLPARFPGRPGLARRGPPAAADAADRSRQHRRQP
jgi:hypothetical protein